MTELTMRLRYTKEVSHARLQVHRYTNEGRRTRFLLLLGCFMLAPPSSGAFRLPALADEAAGRAELSPREAERGLGWAEDESLAATGASWARYRRSLAWVSICSMATRARPASGCG